VKKLISGAKLAPRKGAGVLSSAILWSVFLSV